jgi:hypothetical protein
MVAMASDAAGAEQTLELSALIGGRFRIGAILGQGGMGAVYRVLDERTDRKLAPQVDQNGQIHPALLRPDEDDITAPRLVGGVPVEASIQQIGRWRVRTVGPRSAAKALRPLGS